MAVRAFNAGPIFLLGAIAAEMAGGIAVAANNEVHVARLVTLRGFVALLTVLKLA